MKMPDLHELYAAPELALLPALVSAVDATLATLRAQHGTLEECGPGEPHSLVAARVFVAELARARLAALAYARATRRALRDPDPDDDLPLPF